MFKEVDRLEKLLEQMLAASKKVDAKQSVYAEDIHLGDGATLNISMNNIVLSTESLAECVEIVREIKKIFPRNGNTLTEAISIYRVNLVEKALDHTGGNQEKAAKALGITRRQIRYRINTTKEVVT